MIKKRYLAVTMAAAMMFGTLAGAGCGDRGGGSSEREESEPIVFAIDGMDGVYSPFFATAAYDSEIAGQTQLGMLTTNTKKENGSTVAEVAYGDDYACVVKDMNTTYLDSNKRPTSSARAAYTQYDFLIKKGIKFADGVELTIDDILFNLYVYLDPSYTGSSTMYSTEIVGLEDFRTQGRGDESSVNEAAAPIANSRLEMISQWCINEALDDPDKYHIVEGDQYKRTELNEDEVAMAKEYANYFITQYDTELSSDYNVAESGLAEARKTYMFDAGEYWEYFLFMNGMLNYVTDSAGKAQKKFVRLTDLENGEYEVLAGVTEEDPENDIYEVYTFDFGSDAYGHLKEQVAGMNDEQKREWAIKTVYANNVGERSEQPGAMPDLDYLAFSTTVLTSTTTNELYNYILTDVISELSVWQGKTITGITSDKVTSFTGEKTGNYKLDGEYDVLTITIEKVDPKAIWNFAFTVAPRHYYAPTELLQELGLDKDEDHPINYGVPYSSATFMNQVLKRVEVQQVPMGAGPYMASKRGGLAKGETPTPGQFVDSNVAYYERNPYFDLVDGVENGGPIQNAKIKYFRYQKINSSFMLQSLQSGQIDVGTPNATDENIDSVDKTSGLSYDLTRTNGYGYVGINAGHEEVSNVWVRRAIMKALNVSMIDSYFGPGLSEHIYRPMSLESWAYPPATAGGNAPYTGTSIDGVSLDYRFDSTGDQILAMLKEQKFELRGDSLYDPDGNVLKRITFTVAGSTTDHPAYLVFQYAKDILEDIGFDIAVETRSDALTQLNTGGLMVWAAAWSSTIDPDMYQVYHKDSMAGSTVNWGYKQILADSTEKYKYERDVIDRLSEEIDAGREYLEQADRRTHYWKALDYVMELAVEFPLYQRFDLTVYNSSKIDSSTLKQDPNAYEGIFSKIWEVGYVD